MNSPGTATFRTRYSAGVGELEILFQVHSPERDVGLMHEWPEWTAYHRGREVDDDQLTDDEKMEIRDKCMDTYRGQLEDAQIARLIDRPGKICL